MHTDMIPNDGPIGHRMKAPKPQGDGRKPLPHLLTSAVTIVATVLIAHFTGVAKGPQGQPGTDTVITKTASTDGICTYFGKDSAGHTRFQVFSPQQAGDGSPWCSKGEFVSVIPGK